MWEEKQAEPPDSTQKGATQSMDFHTMDLTLGGCRESQSTPCHLTINIMNMMMIIIIRLIMLKVE